MIPKLRIMGRQTVHTTRRSWRPLGLLPAATAAAAGRAPVIVNVNSGDGSEITVGAKINPEGLETTYEIKLVCENCGPPGYAPATGQLPAVEEARTVSLNLTGINPGAYRFDVYASNTAGNVLQEGELNVPPGSPCPDGCSKNEEYTAEIPPWYIEYARAQSAQVVKGYEAKQAREQQEKKTKEAACYAAEEAELKQAEEREAQEAAARESTEREEQEAEHPAGHVPALKGKTLAVARLAIAKAHCRLGAIHEPAHGARIALWCGAKRASHRGRGTR